MQEVSPEVVKTFGNKVRIRVCGILIEDNKILLVNHRGLNTSNQFWSPPGGGLEFGESAPQSLCREFAEETGYKIEVNQFLFVNEYISNNLHAVELFFEVKAISCNLAIGADPELATQIIQEVKFMSMNEISLLVTSQVHSIFHKCKNLEDIWLMKGKFINS